MNPYRSMKTPAWIFFYLAAKNKIQSDNPRRYLDYLAQHSDIKKSFCLT